MRSRMRFRHASSKASAQTLPQVMDYTALSERIKKTLYYGSVPDIPEEGFEFSHSLTSVVVESFGQHDNLFLEKLCFDYAADLSTEACLSPCSLVLALIYLERLSDKNPNFVSSIPSSKLFLISVMVASKFLNDDGEEDEVVNAEWASSAKIDLSELNQLERQFLQAIDWALFVDDQDFISTLDRIECRVAQREGLKRGWLTYTDVDVLTRTRLLIDTWRLVHSLVVNVSVACMTAYLASLVTLVGSALVVSSMPWNTANAPTTSLSPLRLDSPASSNTTSALPNPAPQTEEDLEELADLSLSLDLPESFIDLPGNILSSSQGLIVGTFPHLSNPPYFIRISESSPPPSENSTFSESSKQPDKAILLPRCTLTESVSRFSGLVPPLPLCISA